MSSGLNSCPKCNTSFIGEPIPQEYIDKGYYGDSTHYRREIGIDGGYAGIYDGIVAWQCPDCKHEFSRGDSTWAKQLFQDYQDSKQGKEFNRSIWYIPGADDADT